MKKAKITGDIAVMEVSHQSTMGSRTRAAKTLALQRLSKTTTTSGSTEHGVGLSQDVSSFSYLQLRSRRLQKLASPVSNKTKPSREGKGNGLREVEKRKGCLGNKEIIVGVEICCGTTEEACFGGELRHRNTRGSLSCGLINDLETIAALGSTTKPRTSPSTHGRGLGNNEQRSVPTAQEMEEFFVCAERQQQRQFIEKYNFDIVNDLPLPGRYEWEKITP